ncbi:MAG: lipoprotein [Luteimonas sp.]|nr:lipoprotein [Luteimonas sp.]
MRTLSSLLSLALLALLLAACGNKGPLVLPSPDEAEIVPDDDPAPDPAESADEAVEQPPVDDANDEAGDEGEPETPPAGTPDRSGR